MGVPLLIVARGFVALNPFTLFQKEYRREIQERTLAQEQEAHLKDLEAAKAKAEADSAAAAAAAHLARRPDCTRTIQLQSNGVIFRFEEKQLVKDIRHHRDFKQGHGFGTEGHRAGGTR